jgi:hypothetical protein
MLRGCSCYAMCPMLAVLLSKSWKSLETNLASDALPTEGESSSAWRTDSDWGYCLLDGGGGGARGRNQSRLQGRGSDGVAHRDNFASSLSTFHCPNQYLKLKLKFRPTVGRPVCLGVGLSSGTHVQIFLSCVDTDGSVIYCTIPSESCQSSHSRVRVPQEQGGPVIPSGTGFPFCHLLRLAGLR